MITKEQLKPGNTYWNAKRSFPLRYTKETFEHEDGLKLIDLSGVKDELLHIASYEDLYTELPINFNTENVQAVLRDDKLQTRMPLKQQPKIIHTRVIDGDTRFWDDFDGKLGNEIKTPYQSDYLWVREAFAKPNKYNSTIERYYYKADNLPTEFMEARLMKWKPSIHMPREASRIQLKVTGHRVERLHNITEADAMAEGIKMISGSTPVACEYYDYEENWYSPGEPIFSFFTLWQSIYAKTYPWESNPWVSITEFEMVK